MLFRSIFDPGFMENPGPTMEVLGVGSQPFSQDAFRGYIALDIRDFTNTTDYYNGLTVGSTADSNKDSQQAYICGDYPGPGFPTFPNDDFQLAVIHGNDSNANNHDLGPCFAPGDPMLVTVYDGTTYTVAYFSTNGALNFLNYDANLSHVAIPATTTPNAALFPFWDDLMVDSKASVWTATIGTAPNRTFVVEWRNLRPFGYADSTTIRMSFEVLLSESGEITFNYQGLDTNTARALGSSATIGIETPTGSAGISYSYNEAALRNGLSIHFYGPVSDLTAPTAPTGFTATGASGSSMLLEWTSSTDNVAVAGYTISRDGTQIATVDAAAKSYTDTGLVQGRSYSYSIVARDGAGNVSQPATASGTTLGDGVAPSVPAGLRVTAASTATLSLAWNGASDNVGVSGYRVFANGVEVGTTASTSYAVTTPAAATTYTVSAYDAAGNESGTGGQAAITWPGYDSTAPSWSVASPTLRVVTQSSNKWTLAWDSATDNLGGLAYRIYTTTGKLVATTSSTSWSGTKQRGAVYYVVAVDIAGNFSGPTNQVTG